MTKYVLLAVVTWAISAYVCGGKFYSQSQEIGSVEFARKNQPDDRINAVFMGCIYGCLGPVGIAFACFLSSWISPLWKSRGAAEGEKK